MKYKCSTNADNAGKPFWPAYSVYLKGKTVNTYRIKKTVARKFAHFRSKTTTKQNMELSYSLMNMRQLHILINLAKT